MRYKMSINREVFDHDISEAIDYFTKLTNDAVSQTNLNELKGKALAGFTYAENNHDQLALDYLQNFSNQLRNLMLAKKQTDNIENLQPQIDNLIRSAALPAELSVRIPKVSIGQVVGGIVGGIVGIIVGTVFGAIAGLLGLIQGSGPSISLKPA